MNIFSKFKKVLGLEKEGVSLDKSVSKSNVIKVYAPVGGTLVKMEDIPDEAFSAGMLGQSIAVKPSATENVTVFSPMAGEVKVAYDTGHAYFIEDEPSQVTLLLHLGIDTVNIPADEKAFVTKVKVGEQVTTQSPLCEMNLKVVHAKAPSELVILSVQNDNLENKRIIFVKKSGPVNAGDLLLTIEPNA